MKRDSKQESVMKYKDSEERFFLLNAGAGTAGATYTLSEGGLLNSWSYQCELATYGPRIDFVVPGEFLC